MNARLHILGRDLQAVWADSRVFRRTISEMVRNTSAFDYDTDTVKAALYNNSITPDNDVTTAVLQGYNGTGSQWVVANEVSDGAEWAAGGVALAGKTVEPPDGSPVADFVKLDATDTASGTSATLANVFGTLVYDDTLADKPGFSYNYFGGTQSVTDGTFTIVWHANGVIRFAL